MVARLAAVCLLVFCLGCGSDDGSTFTSFPVPQWGRGRADQLNSAFGSTGFTNTGTGTTSRALGGGPILTTPIIGVSGNVFVATSSGKIVALTSDLNPLWEFFDPTLGSTRSSPAVDTFDNIFFGTDGGWVVGLDSSGDVLWTTNVGGAVATAVVSSPMLVLDPFDGSVQAVLVGTSDGRILAIGGPNGEIRWQFLTGGAVDGDLVFDGLTLYAASADGFLYSLTQRGSQAFPRSALGAVAAPFGASPCLLGQTVAQPGLAGSEGGGRMRGFTLTGSLPIWDAAFPAEIRASAAQWRHAINQVVDGQENSVAVTDYLALDIDGNAWIVDPQIGSPGTRCIGGAFDQRPCFDDSDCNQTGSAPSVCQPLQQCIGGANDGMLCRSDDVEEDCPGGICRAITKCASGNRAGEPCNHDGDCEGGVCSFSVFSLGAPVEVAPITSADATILVATAPATGPGTLYAIELPGLSVPSPSTCPAGSPEFCRFAQPAAGAIRAAPSVNLAGAIYFGDDGGNLYVIPGT